MRILACDPVHKYFFIGVNEEELKAQIIPLHEEILEEYSHDHYPTILVSSVKIREKELEDQKKIKANPFISKTKAFSIYLHEVPDFDAFIVVNPKLTELYFVPFDFFAPEKWGTSGEWCRVDKKDIDNIVGILDIPFTHDGGVKYNAEWKYTKGEAAELLDDLLDYIPIWKKKGPKKVFSMVMPHYQAYRLYVEELDALLYKGGVRMPREWWDQDQMHLKTQADYFEEKEEPYTGTRDVEGEDALIYAMKEDGRSDTEVLDALLFDYLDDIITWDVLYGYYCGYDVFDMMDKMDDKERRRFIWLGRYDTENCPFSNNNS